MQDCWTCIVHDDFKVLANESGEDEQIQGIGHMAEKKTSGVRNKESITALNVHITEHLNFGSVGVEGATLQELILIFYVVQL